MNMVEILLSFTVLVLLAELLLIRKKRKDETNRGSSHIDRDSALNRIAQLRCQLPTEMDQQACDRIEARIRAVSSTFSMQTSISPKKVYELAAELTRDIASVYHPEADDPVLQASISDLLQLNERVVTRLNIKLKEFPLSTVKDININRIMKGKHIYDAKIKNKIKWLQKFKGLYKAGNRAWMSYNIFNPWYWGRKIAYTSVKEITFRYLLTWIVTIVGEEAMAVYSQRDITTSDAAYERDLALAMVAVARANKTISAEAYAQVIDHIINKMQLSDTVRVDIARALTAKKSKTYFLPQGSYTRTQVDRLLKKINKLAVVQGSNRQKSYEIIEKIESELRTKLNNE